MTDMIVIAINWPLIILSLVAVGSAGAWAAVKGWSLFKATIEVERQLTPMVGGLADRAAAAAERAESAAGHGTAVIDNIARIEQSVGRLTVLLRAAHEASARWQRLRSFVT